MMGSLLSLAILAYGYMGPWRDHSGEPAIAKGITAAPSVKVDPAVVEQLRAVVQRHDKALSHKSLSELMATFSASPNTVVLGTGAAERWVGPKEIREAYTHIFQGYDAGTLTTSPEWRTGGATGNMAYLAGTWNAKDSLKGKLRQYALNVSAALQKQHGKWHIVMLHMSNPTGPSSAGSGPSQQ
jgi:hypothetical protein